MRARVCISGLIVLLALGGYCISIPPSRSDGACSPQHTQSSSAIFRALSDLDGDSLADLATLHVVSGRHTLELYLSRTDEWVVLSVRAVVGSDRALSAQDIDGDGDTDLLWQRSRRPQGVMVWLNAGAGQFECLCPPESRPGGSAFEDPAVGVAHGRHADSALSPEHTFVPGSVLTSGWDVPIAATCGALRPEFVWAISGFKRFLSTRSPPALYC